MEGTQVSHYRIGRMLGRGGMGEVYEAVDLDLGRPVALKFVASELAANPAILKRFEQEATSAARLSHPHIARVYAFHRDPRPPFIDMELVPGGSLRQRIDDGPLAVPVALALVRDVASALAHAHRKEIVHRDIKPENLMFDEEGEVKVMDFGIARALDAARLTMTGTAVGTAAYMAPETVQGAVGTPADVFALGVVLHEALAGELPFPGDQPFALMYSIANAEPRRVSAKRPEAGPEVEDLVLRMLAKDPLRRPDAAEVARTLGVLTGRAPAADSGVLEPPVERLSAPPAPAPGTLAPVDAGAVLAPERRRARGPRAIAWLALAGAVLAVAGTLAWRAADARQRAADARRISDQGMVALRAGDDATARARFEAALARDRTFAPALINLGRVHHALGDDARAESLYSAVLALRSAGPPMRAYAHAALADLDIAVQAWPAAVENLERAFALDSSTVNAYNDLGYTLTKAGRAAEALALLERGAARFPAVATLRKNAGLAALALGDPGRARREADAALAIEPGLPQALALRARARARLGDASGAAADWGAAAGGLPEGPDRAEAARDLAALGVAGATAPPPTP